MFSSKGVCIPSRTAQVFQWIRFTGGLLILLILIPLTAHAQSGSPFDTGLTSIQTLFTGTIAKVASLIAIVIGGYQFAHGEPGAKKSLAGVAAGTEAEQVKREKQRKARVSTYERIIDQAPATMSAAQMRVFLRLLVHIEAHSFLEDVASHFAIGNGNTEQTEEDIVLAALDSTADEKLTGFALRILLSDHVAIPNENQPDLLTEAEQVFAPKKPKLLKPAAKASGAKKQIAKAAAKKEVTREKAA